MRPDLRPELRPEVQALIDRANAQRRPKAAASSKGRVARGAGENDEALINAACELYAARGLAFISKRPTPTKPLGAPDDRGVFRAVWLEPAGVDYMGVLAGGQAIAFEAKGSGDASLPLTRHGKPLLSPQQRRQLDQVTALGGVAGLLVRVQVKPRGGRPTPAWYWLCWSSWQRAEAAAAAEQRASIGVELLEAHGRPCAREGILPAFLAAVHAAGASCDKSTGGGRDLPRVDLSQGR